MRKRDLGYCEVSTDGPGAWHLQRDQFVSVRTAWLKGVRFVDTVSFYGAPLTIKLDNVDSVEDVPPDALAACRADKRQDEEDDSLMSGPS